MHTCGQDLRGNAGVFGAWRKVDEVEEVVEVGDVVDVVEVAVLVLESK